MSKDTDYLGRRMVCNTANVDRMLDGVIAIFKGQPTVDAVAVMETILADLVFTISRDRADSHVGIDRIAGDMKEYLNSRFAQRDQRRDQVGHA